MFGVSKIARGLTRFVVQTRLSTSTANVTIRRAIGSLGNRRRLLQGWERVDEDYAKMNRGLYAQVEDDEGEGLMIARDR